MVVREVKTICVLGITSYDTLRLYCHSDTSLQPSYENLESHRYTKICIQSDCLDASVGH